MARAIWNNTVIAESTAFEEVEGNIYFPADSVRSESLRESATRTRCAWKGEAHYCDVLVDALILDGSKWKATMMIKYEDVN